MQKSLHTLTAVALALATTGVQAEDKNITIGTNSWAENIAVSNLWKLILEEKGYNVELTNMSRSALYAGIANGGVDLSLEIWLPHSDKNYLEPYKNKIDVHEAWYDKTSLGLVVPEYVDINTIPQLAKNAHEFEYRGQPTILGIDAGSALSTMTDKAIEAYDLPLTQASSSEAAMLSMLDSATEREEPIAVTLWKPHWTFSKYSLKYLEDPKNIYGDGDTIYWFSRDSFSEDAPWLTRVFNAWHMSDKSLSELLADVKSAGSPVAGAKQWMNENEAKIEKWLSADDTK
ncbi:glycine betaine ABC transporter substrate-binding protein [Chromohalobacter sp. 296-RDG]|uniref:glycine betaine ABC transporter substrate-binding protein n=1 Tax=Chromohalobacter sp. 296-RDG TaxID=2994062 RepID=UPI0024687F09|nr:glycine betaine ABC transporter substrate-binding protein [Chromohalobacter sp. 296-RDG]